MVSTKVPDRLYIRNGDREKYRKILDTRGSPFYEKDNKDPFLFAILLGFRKNLRIELGPSKDGWILMDRLTQEDKSMIKSLVVKFTGSLEILANQEYVYELAEQFAAGGIDYLEDEIFNKTNTAPFSKRLERELMQIIGEIANPK